MVHGEPRRPPFLFWGADFILRLRLRDDHLPAASTIVPRVLFWGADFILRLSLRDDCPLAVFMLYGTPIFQSKMGCRVPYETPISLSQENMLKQAQ